MSFVWLEELVPKCTFRVGAATIPTLVQRSNLVDPSVLGGQEPMEPLASDAPYRGINGGRNPQSETPSSGRQRHVLKPILVKTLNGLPTGFGYPQASMKNPVEYPGPNVANVLTTLAP